MNAWYHNRGEGPICLRCILTGFLNIGPSIWTKKGRVTSAAILEDTHVPGVEFSYAWIAASQIRTMIQYAMNA